MSRNILSRTLFALSAVLASTAFGGETQSPVLDKAASTDPVVFERELSQERQHFSTLIRDLIDILNTAPDASSGLAEMRQMGIRQVAAEFLGELSAKDAIPTLIVHLTDVKAINGTARNLEPQIGQYPCALALVEIGKPAGAALVDAFALGRIKRADVPVATYVLQSCLGLKDAVDQLNRSVAAADPAGKNILSEALQRLKGLAKPNTSPQRSEEGA